jgi:Protein of unknown function (DUF3455)
LPRTPAGLRYSGPVTPLRAPDAACAISEGFGFDCLRDQGDRLDGLGVPLNPGTGSVTATPWLRLSAASTAAAPDGDRLVDTTYIQRIATTGGLAPPSAECNAATAGTRAEVPYTADYYFWKRTAA